MCTSEKHFLHYNQASARLLFWILALPLTLAIVLQFWFAPSGPLPMVLFSSMLSLCLIGVALFRQGPLLRFLSSVSLASTALALLATASALGTLVIQNRLPEFYLSHYGMVGKFILYFCLNDVFHSLWFGALISLLVAGLVTSSLSRWPITMKNLGFFAVHWGIVLLLCGAGISSIFVVKGRIDLHVEGPAASAVTVTRSGLPTPAQIPLGASIKLQRFVIQYYPPRINFYVPATKDRKTYERKAAFPIKLQTVYSDQGLPQGVSFKVIAQEKSASLTSQSPHLIRDSSGRSYSLKLGQTITLQNGASITALRFFPHFNYNIETKQAMNISDSPVNPALEVRLGNLNRWLFAKMPGFGHKKEEMDLFYSYTPKNSLSSSLENQSTNRTLVRLEISDSKTTRQEDLGLDDSSKILFSGGFLAFETPTEEIQSFQSHLLVRTMEKEFQPILAVNHPVKVGSWMLYQSNFSQNDPGYSGIEAVQDPGIIWVWAGFALIFGGIVHMLYIAPRLKRKS
jgi:hypothetical protein